MTKQSIGKACKHAFFTPNKRNPDNDLIVAKVTEYFDDGTEKSKLTFKENFPRDFYIVKPKYRTFKQKKGYIEANKVKKFSSNQSRLAYNITKVLYGRPNRGADLGQLKKSPYLFGCHESPAVVFKQRYYDHFTDAQMKAYYHVAAYDVETYVVEDEFGEINMASVTFNDKVFWCGLREFFPDEKTDEEKLAKLKEAQEKYLSKEYIEKYNVTLEYKLVDKPEHIVVNCVSKWHEWMPDYIVSWHANFDMQRNEDALVKARIDPRFVYSDPRVPDHYKDYVYDKGREHKRKIDGSVTALEDQERFPTVRAPAGWQWFDGMSFFAISRVAEGKRESYSLQNTAKEEGIITKLYTKEGSHLLEGSVDWHKYMQKHYPYIYAMYNIQDNWVIEELNRKTQDYSLALPSLITSSELQSYQSQPQLISDELSFIALKNGYVWGVTGPGQDAPFKDILPSRKDWIALLHTELNENNGRALFEGLPNVLSLGHEGVNDLDVKAAYPTEGIALNVSNETTQVEVCKVKDHDETDFRRLGINYISSVPANSTLLATQIYELPDLMEIESFYHQKVEPYSRELAQQH